MAEKQGESEARGMLEEKHGFWIKIIGATIFLLTVFGILYFKNMNFLKDRNAVDKIADQPSQCEEIPVCANAVDVTLGGKLSEATLVVDEYCLSGAIQWPKEYALKIDKNGNAKYYIERNGRFLGPFLSIKEASKLYSINSDDKIRMTGYNGVARLRLD